MSWRVGTAGVGLRKRCGCQSGAGDDFHLELRADGALPRLWGARNQPVRNGRADVHHGRPGARTSSHGGAPGAVWRGSERLRGDSGSAAAPRYYRDWAACGCCYIGVSRDHPGECAEPVQLYGEQLPAHGQSRVRARGVGAVSVPRRVCRGDCGSGPQVAGDGRVDGHCGACGGAFR